MPTQIGEVYSNTMVEYLVWQPFITTTVPANFRQQGSEGFTIEFIESLCIEPIIPLVSCFVVIAKHITFEVIKFMLNFYLSVLYWTACALSV